MHTAPTSCTLQCALLFSWVELEFDIAYFESQKANGAAMQIIEDTQLPVVYATNNVNKIHITELQIMDLKKMKH